MPSKDPETAGRTRAASGNSSHGSSHHSAEELGSARLIGRGFDSGNLRQTTRPAALLQRLPLPLSPRAEAAAVCANHSATAGLTLCAVPACPDRKSTRLNSSHQIISYAVFCLKKKNNNHT